MIVRVSLLAFFLVVFLTPSADAKMYVEGKIVALGEKGEATINIGRNQGLAKGRKFVIVRPEEKIVGELRVEVANAKDSLVKLTHNAQDVVVGDFIRQRTSPVRTVRTKAVGYRKIHITWEKSPEPEIEKYAIYRADEKKGPYKKIDTVRARKHMEFLDKYASRNKLEDSTRYYYKVTAINDFDAESDWSNYDSSVTYGPPEPPENFEGRSDRIRAVPLAWDLPSDEEVAGYKIYRYDPADKEYKEIATIKERKTTTYTDYGGGSQKHPKLEDTTTYYYKISAYSPYDDIGPQSKKIALTTAPPPSPPTGLEVTGWQPRQVPIVWDVHKDANIVGYRIFRSTDEKGPFKQIEDIKGRKKNNYTDGKGGGGFFGGSSKALKDFTTYFYYIVSYNWAGSVSPPSPVRSAATKAGPLPVENFVVKDRQPHKITLSWRKNPEVDIKEYEIFTSDSETGDFKKLTRVKATVNKYVHNELGNGETHYYKLRAIDSSKLNGEFSRIASGVTKPTPKPVQDVRRDGRIASLIWKKNGEKDIATYRVYKKGGFGWRKLGDTPSTSFSDLDLDPGDTARFAVTAIDLDGLESEKSAEVTIDLR